MIDYDGVIRRWASIDVIQAALNYKKLSLYKKLFRKNEYIVIVNDLDKNRKFYCFCGFKGAADLYISSEEEFLKNLANISRATIEPDFEFKLDAIFLAFDSEVLLSDFELRELKKAGVKFTGSLENKYPFIKTSKYLRYFEDISNDDAETFKFVINAFSFAESNLEEIEKKVKKSNYPNLIEFLYSESKKTIELKNRDLTDKDLHYDVFEPENSKSITDYIGEYKQSGIWEIGFCAFPHPVPLENSDKMIFDDLLIIIDHATGQPISLKNSQKVGKVPLVDEFLSQMKKLKQVPRILFAKNLETEAYFSKIAEILNIEIIVPKIGLFINDAWISFSEQIHSVTMDIFDKLGNMPEYENLED